MANNGSASEWNRHLIKDFLVRNWTRGLITADVADEWGGIPWKDVMA